MVTTAAGSCTILNLNDCNDWFLPSRDELILMYNQKQLVGGFTDEFYWSSSEGSDDYSWGVFFNSGTQTTSMKVSKMNVRAIRSF
ncbi:MAG: DUF1566 domain-containing protein [Bacteroidetes bacterium]|nr:DUF1566 domain-containing protein [Bacteroidota bacterium]